MSALPSPERMGEWLHGGDTGMSSKAIFYYMALGIKGGWTPSDGGDLGRCVRLLDQFPEWADRIQEMAAVSNDWAALVSIWDEIVAAYRDDVASHDKDREWASDNMLRDLWYEKTELGLLRRRKHAPERTAP